MKQNPHDIVEIFHINVSCEIVNDKIVGPFVFKENLMGATNINFLKNNLLAHLKDGPLQTRLQIIFQLGQHHIFL